MNLTRITLQPRQQQGMSLVELLVAITISLILLAGVLQVYDSSRKTYKLQDGLSRLQENARFTFDLLSRDVRMIGFSGCGNVNSGTTGIKVNNIVSPPDPNIVFDVDSAVNGLNDIGATTYGGINAIPGTDVIVARSASPASAQLTGNLAVRNANIQLGNNSLGLQAGDVLFVTDCENADIFKATTVSNAGGTTTIAHSTASNTTNFLSKLYMSDAQILRFQSNTYFIGDTGRVDGWGNPITALFRQNLAGVEELVEGVEDMQITYGVNTDMDLRNSADAYMTANAIAANQWRNVVSARISFLLNTVEGVNTKAQQYTFQGVPTTPAATDRRLRRSFTTTIALRNRAL